MFCICFFHLPSRVYIAETHRYIYFWHVDIYITTYTYNRTSINNKQRFDWFGYIFRFRSIIFGDQFLCWYYIFWNFKFRAKSINLFIFYFFSRRGKIVVHALGVYVHKHNMEKMNKFIRKNGRITLPTKKGMCILLCSHCTY